MPRLSRRLGVVIALICVVLILLFLTVKEVGRFSTSLPVTGLRAERASVPEELSLIIAALIVALLINYFCRDAESSVASATPSFWPIPLSRSLSALRC